MWFSVLDVTDLATRDPDLGAAVNELPLRIGLFDRPRNEMPVWQQHSKSIHRPSDLSDCPSRRWVSKNWVRRDMVGYTGQLDEMYVRATQQTFVDDSFNRNEVTSPRDSLSVKQCGKAMKSQKKELYTREWDKPRRILQRDPRLSCCLRLSWSMNLNTLSASASRTFNLVQNLRVELRWTCVLWNDNSVRNFEI